MEIGLLRAVTTVVLDDNVETNALVARGNPATARVVMEDNTLIVRKRVEEGFATPFF